MVVLTTTPIKTVPSDHMEALWRNVLEVAAHELSRGECHDLLLGESIVFVAEADSVTVEREETALAERSTVQVATKVVEDGGWVAVALTYMNVPALLAELKAELIHVRYSPACRKTQAFASGQLPKAIQKLASEQPLQRLCRQEVPSSAVPPAALLVRTSGGDQAVDVWMKCKLLTPRVQSHQRSRPSPEIARITGEREQRLPCRTEEQIAQRRLIELPQAIQLVGDGKDHMVVGAPQ